MEDGAESEAKPSPEDAAAGRTEHHAAVIRVGYDKDEPIRTRRLTFWSRPGKGRILQFALAPPGRNEPLPLKGSVELQAMAVTDLAEGEARLMRREGATRLILPPTKQDDDRLAVMRLYLDIEPAVDAGEDAAPGK